MIPISKPDANTLNTTLQSALDSKAVNSRKLINQNYSFKSFRKKWLEIVEN